MLFEDAHGEPDTGLEAMSAPVSEAKEDLVARIYHRFGFWMVIVECLQASRLNQDTVGEDRQFGAGR